LEINFLDNWFLETNKNEIIFFFGEHSFVFAKNMQNKRLKGEYRRGNSQLNNFFKIICNKINIK
jgi:hypothetical protein